MYTRVAIPYLASVHQHIGPTSHVKWALLTASYGSIRVMQKLMPTDLKALSLTLSILQISIMLYKQSKPYATSTLKALRALNSKLEALSKLLTGYKL